MPAAPREYTPIRPRGGGLVHAVCFEDPRRTACRKRCDGWVIEPARLTCQDCKRGILLPVTRDARAQR